MFLGSEYAWDWVCVDFSYVSLSLSHTHKNISFIFHFPRSTFLSGFFDSSYVHRIQSLNIRRQDDAQSAEYLFIGARWNRR